MRRLAGVLIVVAVLVAAPAAHARDVTVSSFDGTPIAASLFPAAGLPAGGRAPTVLMTHGWGLVRERDENAASTEQFGVAGVKALRTAGFNVLTWDSRGFGESGGTVEVDSKDFEGRDVQSLLDWLATQPEALLDGPGDPRAGMHGASYAGGIELVSAAIDPRIDAIAPAIAWHSLLTALYREDLAKAGWGGVLGGLGLPTATLLGLIAPSGVQTGTLDPHILSALLTGAGTGRFSDADKRWFADRGPAAIAWLERYLARDASVDTGPRFEWLADDAKWRSADRFPLPPGPPLTAAGTGTLAFSPADAASGGAIAAGPAVNAIDVPIAAPAARTAVVGEPRLELAYSGTSAAPDVHVFAQILDQTRGVVLGNQATPIRLTLDGAPHRIARSLEGVAASAGPGSRYVLQVTGGSSLYGPVRNAGVVRFSSVKLALPTGG